MPTETTCASSATSAVDAVSEPRVLTATGRFFHAAKVRHRGRIGDAVIVRAGHDDRHPCEVRGGYRRRNLPLQGASVPWIGESPPGIEEPGVDDVAGEQQH